MELKEIADTLQKYGEAFEEFKKVTAEEVKEAKELGAATSETKAKLVSVEKTLESLDEIRARLEKVEVKQDEPDYSNGGADKKELEHVKAFEDYVRSVREGSKSGDSDKLARLVEAQKAVSIGTATAGGHAVPEVISRQIDKKLLDISDVLPVIRVVDVGTSDYKELVDTRGTSGGWVGEAGSRSETNTSTLEQVAPTFGMVYAYPKATEESLQDIFFNVQSWIVDSAAEEFAKLIGEAVISGNGTNKPTGFLNGSPSAVADEGASPERPFGTIQYIPSGIAGSLGDDHFGSPSQGRAIDALINTIYAMKAGYRSNARWAMNKSTLSVVRKYRNVDGDLVWQPSLQMGQPSMLLGYPVSEWEGMPSVGSNTFPIAFGDFRAAYTFCNRVGTSITIDDNITTPGYVKFYIRRRVGGILRNDDALKVVKCAAS